MPNTVYPSGLGFTDTDSIAGSYRLDTDCYVWFVHSGTGSNSYSGATRKRPWASVAYASTQVGVNDIVVILDGHDETISALTISKGIYVGVGTVTLRMDPATASGSVCLLIDGENPFVNGGGVSFRNITFPAVQWTSQRTVGAITASDDCVEFRGCTFGVGAYEYAALHLTQDNATLVDCTFTVELDATTPGTPPTCALVIDGAESPINWCMLEDVTIDGGDYGFNSTPQYALTVANVTALRGHVALRGGAGAYISGGTGWLTLSGSDDGAAVSWEDSTFWPNGIGITGGDRLTSEAPMICSGAVIFVSSVTGNDANNGRNVSKPYATLSAAIAGSSAGDIIVLAADHAETTSSLTLLTGQTLVGCGLNNGIPGSTLTLSHATNMLINMGAGSDVRNIAFAFTGTPAGAYIKAAAQLARVVGCHFSQGAYPSISVWLDTGADGAKIEDTTVLSTTNSATGGIAIQALACVYLRGVVIDDGVGGWRSFSGIDDEYGAVGLRIEDTSLLRGGDILLNGTSKYIVTVGTHTGDGRIGAPPGAGS